ncbi:hypothetical protein, partial [Burkholderia multivorans]|uniref:hypothetical protein n=1 Tax=Burkholderia multivorans TaxID=87883 RepID=UPI0011B942E3
RAQFVELRLQLAGPVEAGPLGLPRRLEAAEVLLLVREVGAQVAQPLLGGGQAEKAQRDTDLETASRLLYGEIPAVQKEIAEAEAEEAEADAGQTSDPMVSDKVT